MFWDIFIHILFLYYFLFCFVLFCFYSPLFSFLFSILSLYMSLYLDDSLDDSRLNIQNKFDKLYYDNTESIKEPIESISLMCIYVSTDSCIQHVSKNVVMIDPSGVISKDSFFSLHELLNRGEKRIRWDANGQSVANLAHRPKIHLTRPMHQIL